MSNKIRNFETKFVFILSPFFSIPFLVKGIVNKSKVHVYLLMGVIAFVSLMYLPEPSNDRSHYYSLYNLYKIISFKEFLIFLKTKTDFIFYSLIFIAAQLKIPLNFLFAIILFLTLNNYYKSFFTLSKKYDPGKLFALFIFFILFSFQIKGLLSGVRFYLAASFMVRALILSSKSTKLYVGLPYLLIAVFTHFSTAIFAPVYLLYFYFKRNDKLILYSFLVSFAFIFVPRDLLADKLMSIFDFSGIYEQKITGYLGEEDYLEDSKQVGNFNNYLRLIFNSLWLYIAYYYFIFYRKKKSLLKNLLLSILAITNVFFSSPGTYYRLMFVPIIFFIFLLLRDYSQGVSNKKIIYLVFLLVSLNFWGNFYAIRSTLGSSLIKLEALTGPTMIMKEDINYYDIK